MSQALSALLSSRAISIALVFLLIVALYNSYRTPFVTLFAIRSPSSRAGALVDHPQHAQSLFAARMILLVGLVTKNGILLVDYADTVRLREGKSRKTGSLKPLQTRFRPIIMTTLAMVAGMLPLALGLEPGRQRARRWRSSSSAVCSARSCSRCSSCRSCIVGSHRKC